jgi:hypothetical protein
MEISIVPQIINSMEIKFTDVNGFPISICKESKFKFNYGRFQNPFILIDAFEKENYKSIEIKKISLEELERLGYRLVSVKPIKNMRNRRGQNKSYLLEFESSPIGNSEILLRVPQNHSIELDITNNRIRLKGANVWPYRRNENATPWVEINDK